MPPSQGLYLARQLRAITLLVRPFSHTVGGSLCQCQYKTPGNIEGILPEGPYLSCVSMADRAILAGYHRYSKDIWWPSDKVLWATITFVQSQSAFYLESADSPNCPTSSVTHLLWSHSLKLAVMFDDSASYTVYSRCLTVWITQRTY